VKESPGGTYYRFQTLICECETHAKRILQAREKAAPLFPLNPETYSAITDEAVEHIDQLVYRFTKLQDVLGAKLFPHIVSVLREDANTLTIYDVLTELEKREVIPSAESWMMLREIRNQIAHDYENDPKTGSFYLNLIFNKSTEIVQFSEHTINFIREHILPSLQINK